MSVERPYAGAEALYVAASRVAPDASRVVYFVRAIVDATCAWDALESRVSASLRGMQARHPLLRAALGPRGFVDSDAPVPQQLLTADNPHAAAVSQLEEEWRIPAESSLFRVRIVLPTHARDGLRGPTPLTVLVRGHHAACDAVSLGGLASELLRGLCGDGSRPENASTAAPDILTVARRELGPAWRRPAQLARAALAHVRGGEVAGPVVQLAPGDEAGSPPLRCLEILLAPAETGHLRARCREHGVGLSAFLLAAAALACETTGRIDLGVALDLRRRARATELQPSALGFYVTMADVPLAVGSDPSPWPLAARAAAVLKSRVEESPEQPFAAALALAPLVPLVARMVAGGRSVFPQTLLFSNVGECAPLFLGIAGLRVLSAGFAASPRASRRLHLSCTAVEGALSICLAHPDGALGSERVARFAAALRRVLAAV